MDPALGVALCWLVFGALHVGLATRRVRAGLVARLGELGFIALFSLIASIGWTVVSTYYAAHRFEGPMGLALGASGLPRLVLMALVAIGITLALASFADYPRSPYAIGTHRTRTPYGLERITRHPFFAGIALAAAAHALLATRLTGALWNVGLALLAALGSWHQDRKLLALRGEPYAAFLASTSFVPFAAVLGGRQRLVGGELPWAGLLLALIAVVALRWFHHLIFSAGGLWVVGATVGGAAVLGLASWWRGRRAAARRTAAVAAPSR
jgi:uncharacterized membrane protein